MSNPANLGAVLYADEASFGDTGVTTFDQRLTTIGPVDISGLTQAKSDPGRNTQYQNEVQHGIRGPTGGQITMTGYLTGHGSTAAATISATELATFLGRMIGASSASQDGGTVTSANDANSFDSTDSTFSAGGILRCGALGDSKGEGQFAAVATHSTTITLLTDLPAAPANSDVLYAPELVYPNESATSSSVTSMRFEILSGNDHIRCWGCYPMSISFSDLNPGQLPKWTATLGVSYWTNASSTFPTATSQDVFSPAPVAAGSFFLANNGTATRGTLNIREFNLNIDMQVSPIMGPGGYNAFQHIVGARRTKCQASFDITTDAETTGTQTHADLFDTDENSINYKHALYTMSVQDGRALAFYFRKCAIDKERPKQFDLDGLNRVRHSYKCSTSATTTSELTLSNFTLAIA